MIYSVLPGAHWNSSMQYAFFSMSKFKSFAVKNLWVAPKVYDHVLLLYLLELCRSMLIVQSVCVD